MSNGEDKSRNRDFYEVLGLKKECSTSDLRNAYKKLAMRWHPDRCAASGSSKKIEEEAKQNFQAIQHAYSVLSDDNKRFLYDVGVYDSDDDENGMGDFLSEMAVMMSQTKPNENGDESFEELQELFEEMFQDGIDSFEGSFSASDTRSFSGSSSSSSNQNSTGMSFVGNTTDNSSSYTCHSQKFCLGVDQQQSFKKGKGARRRTQGVIGGGSGRIRGCKTKGFFCH